MERVCGKGAIKGLKKGLGIGVEKRARCDILLSDSHGWKHGEKVAKGKGNGWKSFEQI